MFKNFFKKENSSFTGSENSRFFLLSTMLLSINIHVDHKVIDMNSRVLISFLLLLLLFLFYFLKLIFESYDGSPIDLEEAMFPHIDSVYH